MDWELIIRAVDGDPAALARLAWNEWSRNAAAFAALLLLEESPHEAAALVAAGIAARRDHGSPDAAAPAPCAAQERHGLSVAVSLAPCAAPALAAWRADPAWAERCIGNKAQALVIVGVAHLTAALRDHSAALHAAASIVARDGAWTSIDPCLAGLGAAGWRNLDDDVRMALRMRAESGALPALGWVWPSLSAAQQEEAARRAASSPYHVAFLIGSIGAAAWQTSDAALRERLIDAAAQAPDRIHRSAPAWSGMSDAERERLTMAVVACGNPEGAASLLSALGGDGRRGLSPAQRDALERLAKRRYGGWRTALLRVADAGWDGVRSADRRALMARAAKDPPSAAALIRAVGIAGWDALPHNVQARMRASVQRKTDALFRCPPALWVDLAGGRSLPPATSAVWTIEDLRAEDADADLSNLPAAHQALVLALAPWRPDDLAPQSPRMARLLVAWNGMTADERADLATVEPWTLAVVVAAARLAAREPAIAATGHQATSAVADVIAGMAQRTGLDAAVRGAVGGMLAARRRWRPWMRAFAPSGDDPLDVWKPWIAAALCGAIPDRVIVLLLMAHGSRRANRCRGG